MPHRDRPQQPTGYADLEWIETDDGSRTLYHSGLHETFHSGCGAVAETLIVYLWNSGILSQLRSGKPAVVLEYGLGTATGLLLTAAIAEHYQTPLLYLALERTLLPTSLYRELQLAPALEKSLRAELGKPAIGRDPNFSLIEFQSIEFLVDAWCQALSSLTLDSRAAPIQTCSSFDETAVTAHILLGWQLSRFVQVQLLIGDATNLDSTALTTIPANGCDTIYFDPFSPETNPELWSSKIFRQAFSFLKPTGTLVSYCVKSSVRRELAASGFEVHKIAGPSGGKREVLCAHKPAAN